MKALVIYTSQTGFTKKYAEWIAKRLQADLLDVRDAKKKKKDEFDQYDAIIYGGWVMAGKVTQSKWFLAKAPAWKGKKLVVYVVGASPMEAPDVEASMKKVLTDEQRGYIQAFYCQGGLDYDKMNKPSKMAMKMLISILNKKKDPTEKDKAMVEMISHSYDISDEKYIEPIVEYVIA